MAGTLPLVPPEGPEPSGQFGAVVVQTVFPPPQRVPLLRAAPDPVGPADSPSLTPSNCKHQPRDLRAPKPPISQPGRNASIPTHRTAPRKGWEGRRTSTAVVLDDQHRRAVSGPLTGLLPQLSTLEFRLLGCLLGIRSGFISFLFTGTATPMPPPEKLAKRKP